MERRYLKHEAARPRVERRNDNDGSIGTIVGYAAVFYREGDETTEYRVGSWFVERIERGAFTDALAEKDDVRCRFDHEGVIGRTKSGTLRLSQDDTGLRYECDVADTQLGRDTLALIERGDVDSSSFAFMPRDEGIEWVERNEEPDIRKVVSVELVDVSPVVFPAYEGTTVGSRAEDSAAAIAEFEARKGARLTAEKGRIERECRIREVEMAAHPSRVEA